MTQEQENTKPNPKIGQIVSFKTHYTRGDSPLLEEVYIAGDDKSIPPFLMITEFLKETKEKFDSDTGDEIIGDNSYNYKVQWFNSQKYEVSETWINSSFFEKDPVLEEKKDPNKEGDSDSKLKKGDRVILKTNALEVKKKRTSIKLDESKSNRKASSVVNFCAPEMIVMSKVAFKPKKPIKDNITGEDIRFYPNRLLKCKYYNPSSDKFSEVLLPEECFEKADTEIENLNEILDTNSVILNQNKLLEVDHISYLHGVYMAYCKNFVDGSEDSFRLNELMPFELLDKKQLIGEEIAPLWKSDEFVSISKFLQREGKYIKIEEGKGITNSIAPKFKNNYFYVSYRNLKGRYTERFIKILKTSVFLIKKANKEDENSENSIGLMVQAHCFLRGEKRTFTFTDERLFAIYDVNEKEILNKKDEIKLLDILPEI